MGFKLPDHVGQLHPIPDSGFHKDTVSMVLDCLQGNKKSIADLLVAMSLAYKADHFTFPLRDLIFFDKFNKPGFEITLAVRLHLMGFIQVKIQDEDGYQMEGKKHQNKKMLGIGEQGLNENQDHAQHHEKQVAGTKGPDEFFFHGCLLPGPEKNRQKAPQINKNHKATEHLTLQGNHIQGGSGS